jgi:cytochrome P450
LGSAVALQCDPLKFYSDMAQRYGEVVRTRLLFWPTYLVFHPDGVRHVLQEHHQNYDRQLFLYKGLGPFFGEGLATSSGPAWLQHRRLMQPAFHRARLAALGTLMTDAIGDMLTGWQTTAQQEQPLEVDQQMLRLTLRILGQALFRVDLSDETDVIGQAFTHLLTLLGEYVYLPFPPLSVPTPGNRRMQAGLRTLNAVVQRLIEERRQPQQTAQHDLLSLLLEAQDEESGQGLSDRQVRDEVFTLLFAGHETSANALTWALYLLAHHPAVEQRLQAEVDMVLAGQTPTVEDLGRLPYTRMVLEETLRLYPPGATIPRRAIAADVIGDVAIPANSLVFLTPYITHRHPDFWEQPEVFDPQRFTSERVAARHRFAYFPFGGGPHLCIGQHFALMEVQLALAMIAQRYQLRLVAGQRIEPQVIVTIRPRSGVKMMLHRREPGPGNAVSPSGWEQAGG